jgi:hypothetical protein
MLEAFKEIGNYDVLFFLPGPEDDMLRIESCLYKNPGEQIGGSELGPEYTVVLFKCDDDEGTYNHDNFDAILADPRIYISGLIPQDWYGVVARKTTTSESFVKDIIAKFKEV